MQHFFGTGIFSDLSLLLSSCYLQYSNSFRVKLLPNSYLLRTGYFFAEVTCSKQRCPQKSCFFKAGTLIQHHIFQNSYFFNKVNSPKDVPFKNSYFLRKAPFWRQLFFQKRNVPQLTFFGGGTFTQLHFLSTATLLTVDSLYLDYPLSRICTCLEQKAIMQPSSYFSLFILNTHSLEYLPISSKYFGPCHVFFSLSRTFLSQGPSTLQKLKR